jgi:hypothetical protein
VVYRERIDVTTMQTAFAYDLTFMPVCFDIQALAPSNQQLTWRQSIGQAAHYICGKSPGDAIANSVVSGFVLGAVGGGITGFLGGEVLGGEVTFGATGLVGAYIGAHLGGAFGAISGLWKGVALAGVCYAAKMY